MKKLFFPAIAMSILVSCSPKMSPDNGWSGSKWVVIQLNGNPVQTSGSDRDAHIQFMPDQKRYSGTSGCNRMTGSYEIDNKRKIKFGDAAITKMACEDMAFENSFLSALKSVDNYVSEENTLLLKSGERVVLKLNKR